MAIGWRNQYTRYREFYLNILNLYKQKADLRAFLEIILSLSTITIFAVFALKPTALTIIALVKEINEKKETLAALTLKVNNLEIAGDVYVQNQDVVPIINSAIGTLPSPEEISKQSLALGGQTGVEILGLSVGEVILIGATPTKKGRSEFKPLPENAHEMPFSVSVRGEYSSLVDFINKFENLRITSKVDILGINSSTTADGQVIVAVISGRIPYIGAEEKQNEK